MFNFFDKYPITGVLIVSALAGVVSTVVEIVLNDSGEQPNN